MKTTMKNHPFGSKQLKEMADQLEGYSVRNMSLYHEADSNTKDAREELMSFIQDDESPRRVLSERRYDSMVESGIKFLQEKRCCEKERFEQYVATEERDIAARKIHRDKETEEQGGLSKYKMSRMKWIPPPDSRCGKAHSRYKFRSS
jgi:hypothetical protein